MRPVAQAKLTTSGRGVATAQAAVPAAPKFSLLPQIEFYSFCAISFTGKSLLLMRLPYREWPVNTAYTCALLLFFYLYFRFRQNMRAPMFVVFSLAAAVAVDILGNKFGFYGHPFGPLRDYDEFAHFAGSGFSAIGAFWLLMAGSRRMGRELSAGILTSFATAIAFTYCGWYEILELFDELFYGDFERIHSWDDTPNDLFYDFLGVVVFVGLIGFLWALRRNRSAGSNSQARAGFRNMFVALPNDLLGVFVATSAFSLCSWFEIFVMFDQRVFGRVHLIGNRDSPTRLAWEMAASVILAITFVICARIRGIRARESS